MSDVITPKLYNVDRYRISARIHLPEGEGPFPSVILLHGFFGHKDEEHIVSLAEELARKGFVAARFDATGFGESEGTVEEDYRLSAYMNDIDTMVDHLGHQEFVQQGVIGLWGHSAGGMLAVCYASEYSEIAAVACVSGPSTFASSLRIAPLLAEWERKGAYPFESSRYGEKDVPWAFVKDASGYSALEAAKELKQPILTVIGLADDRVSPDDTRAIYESATGGKKLVEIEGMGHAYKENPAHLAQVNDATVSFFGEALE
jgi:pimeloyl-ACP methyl ester carboxylesterase